MKLSSKTLAGLLLLCGPASFLSAQPAGPAPAKPAYKPDRLIVKYKKGGQKQRAAAVSHRNGTSVFKPLSRKLGIDSIRVPLGKNLQATLASLKKDADVEYAEFDYLITINETPNDPFYNNGNLWGLNNTGQFGYLADADIDAPEAWEIRSSAAGVKVAVVDTGINHDHPDLAANIWTNPNEVPGNKIDDDGNGYVDDIHGANTIVSTGGPGSGICRDDNDHGTHVAGTIGAAANNLTGVVGIAWQVELIAVKSFDASGKGLTSDAIEAIDYARSVGADVINCSWGGAPFSQGLFDSLRACQRDGILIACSAGNENTDTDADAQYPSCYPIDNIVAVGASTASDLKAGFSCYGRYTVGLFAPGQAIYSSVRNGYSSFNGTSMATPHVAGAMALLKAQFPTETHQEIINRLLNSVDKISAFSEYCQSGGRLNLYNALTSTDKRPFNDDFDKALDLGKRFGAKFQATNGGSTLQSGEPQPVATSGGRSVWFAWTASATGPAHFFTTLSDYDTTLAIFKGSSLAGLTLVSANDNDPSGGIASKVTFTAVKGTRYYLAVDGANGAVGTVNLEGGFISQNDNFADRAVLAGANVSAASFNYGTTAEPQEPSHAENSPVRSVWFTWTAPAAGAYVVDTLGSSFDTVIGIYTGSALGNLTQLTASDDINYGKTRTSRVLLHTEAGVTYQIAVDGWSGAVGDIKLKLSQSETDWSGVKIGSSQTVPYTYEAANDTATFSTTGGNLTKDFDICAMLGTLTSGDGEFQARITQAACTDPNNTAEAGLIIRTRLDNHCPSFGLTLQPKDGHFVARTIRRDQAGGVPLIKGAISVNLPCWVRIAKTGDQFAASVSNDGSSWNLVGTVVPIPMTGSFVAGLIASAGSGGNQLTASFSNTSLDFTGTSIGGGNQGPLVLSGASRLNHLGLGFFEIATSPAPGNKGIETRSIPGRKLQVAVRFDKPIASATAKVNSSSAYLDGAIVISGNEILVPLRLTNDQTTALVELTGIVGQDGSFTSSGIVPLGLLAGDVNADGLVDQADVGATQAMIGVPVDAATARYDIDLNGTINTTDVAKVSSNIGHLLNQ